MSMSSISRKTFTRSNNFPDARSEDERASFYKLQEIMKKQYEQVFPDKLAERTVVIVPSLTLDNEILSKIKGAVHYEERLLCMLMLLRMPLTKLIYVTSIPIPEVIIDYYLNLLPGITGHHARKRLTLISCFDSSVKPLTDKILERPRLIETIKQNIANPETAHLTCFNITPLEKTLAVQLGIPLFGTDPDKFYEGSKSGARKTFRESGVSFPDGFEDLKTKDDVVKALASLKKNNPSLRKAVVKVNDGFSGDGNAIYSYPDVPIDNKLEETLTSTFSKHFRTVAKDLGENLFFEKFASMGGIVEVFLEGETKMSPSVQCVINPNKTIDVVSTHDQLLGGDDGQIFLGAIFPADESYNISLAVEARKIAKTLMGKGAMGRFAVDFLSVKENDNS